MDVCSYCGDPQWNLIVVSAEYSISQTQALRRIVIETSERVGMSSSNEVIIEDAHEIPEKFVSFSTNPAASYLGLVGRE